MNKICNLCSVMITEQNSISTLGKNRIIYIRNRCKKCVIKDFCEKRRTKFSNEWWLKRFYKLKISAKKRKHNFELNLDEYKKILSVNNCYFCGESNITRTIDRLNNLVGYKKNNCVMSCLVCNMMKGKILKNDIPRIKKILEKL